MRELIAAFAFFFFAFYIFYTFSSPSSLRVNFERLDLESVKPLVGYEGGTLSFILNGDPKTLNPVLAQETTSTAVIGELFSGLTKMDLKTMKVIPDLAKSWDELDGGKRYIFRLRENLKWSDGTPITADDVVFTYSDLYLNRDIPNSTGDTLKGVLRSKEDMENFVKKLDTLTVEFRLPSPFAPFLQALSAPILPKHKLYQYVKNGTFMTAWNVNTDPKEVVGSGPYVIKRYIKGQLVEYQANPFYYEVDEKGNRLPYIKTKVGYIIQDPDTALIKFSDKTVDYIGVRAQDVLYISQLKDVKLLDMGPTPSTTFLVFNQNPKAKIPKHKLQWFTNGEFRRAISHAIDREGISYLVYNAMAEPLYSPVTPANRPYYQEGIFPVYEYNLEKAKRILLSAGFKYNQKGELLDRNGNRVEIVLLTNAGNKERETIGNMIKEDLERLGIKVTFRPIDFNTLVSKLTSPPYEWEAVIIGLTGSLDPHFGRNVWHSSGTLHMWNPRQESPQTEWERLVDQLFDLGAITTDQEKRIEIYRKAYTIIAQEQPMIFLATPKSMLAYRPKFINFYPTVWGWYEEPRISLSPKIE